MLRFSICAVMFFAALQPQFALAEKRFSYDDQWWQQQYFKIYDPPHCREIITNMDEIRAFDKKTGLLSAPMTWAVGMSSAKGECAAPASEEALEILTDLAERGEAYPSLFLAQLHHIKYGSNAPETRNWIKRTRNAMPRIVTKDWREHFYQRTAATFMDAGTPFSSQLEHIFLWAEETLKGDAEPIYQYGLKLVEHGTYPEDKVLGCRWLYEAEKRGHVQARFHLARQHILGDGVIQAPRHGASWLSEAVNKDKNKKALLFAAELLEKGGIYKKSLPSAYIALLRAQKLGADVSNRLNQIREQLTTTQVKWAQKDAESHSFSLYFMTSPDFELPRKSGLAPHICKFIPK